MKKLTISILIALGIIANNFVAAQNEVLNLQLDAGNPIVRVIDEKATLVYSEPAVGYGFFMFIQQGDEHARVFNTPSGMSIHDVEVLGNSVYFCGEKNGHGVFGDFEIQAAFSSTGSGDAVSYSFLYDTIDDPSCYNCLVTVDNITRLAVFETPGLTIMAMVYEGYVLGAYSYQSHETSIMSAFRYPGSTIWQTQYLYNKDGLWDYTDIDVTDSYVVAAGVQKKNQECSFHAFQRDPYFLTTYMAIASHNACSIDYPYAYGPVQISALPGDHIALTQFYKFPGTIAHFVDLSPLPSAPSFSIPSLLTFPQSTYPYIGQPWQLKETKFNHHTGTLDVLEWMNHPNDTDFGSWLMHIPVSATPYTVNCTKFTAGTQTSFDIGAYPFISTIGGSVTSSPSALGNLTAYLHIMPSTPVGCITTNTLSTSNLSASINKSNASTAILSDIPNIYLYSPTIYVVPLIQICTE